MQRQLRNRLQSDEIMVVELWGLVVVEGSVEYRFPGPQFFAGIRYSTLRRNPLAAQPEISVLTRPRPEWRNGFVRL